MFMLTRNSAKRVRSSSMDSDTSSVCSSLTSPPLNRKNYRSQISNDSMLTDNGLDSVSRQVSRESNFSDMGDIPERPCIDDVLMEVNMETEMQEEAPIKKATKEIDMKFLQDLDPKTKFDTVYCKISGIAYTAKGDLLVSDASNKKVKIQLFICN